MLKQIFPQISSTTILVRLAPAAVYMMSAAVTQDVAFFADGIREDPQC